MLKEAVKRVITCFKTVKLTERDERHTARYVACDKYREPTYFYTL
jgi:hypothetical protein